MAELSTAVAVWPGNLTGVVDGLRRRVSVDCELNPNDRRSFLVSIAPAGRDEFLPQHWQHLQRLTSDLPQEKRKPGQLHEQLVASV